jgi:hypothetical protein
MKVKNQFVEVKYRQESQSPRQTFQIPGRYSQKPIGKVNYPPDLSNNGLEMAKNLLEGYKNELVIASIAIAIHNFVFAVTITPHHCHKNKYI